MVCGLTIHTEDRKIIPELTILCIAGRTRPVVVPVLCVVSALAVIIRIPSFVAMSSLELFFGVVVKVLLSGIIIVAVRIGL